MNIFRIQEKQQPSGFSIPAKVAFVLFNLALISALLIALTPASEATRLAAQSAFENAYLLTLSIPEAETVLSLNLAAAAVVVQLPAAEPAAEPIPSAPESVVAVLDLPPPYESPSEPSAPLEGAEESVVAEPEPEPAPAPAPEEAVLAAVEPTPEPVASAPETALEALVDSIVADALKAEPDVPVEGAEESVVAEPEPVPAPAPAPEEAVLAAIEPAPEPIAPAPETALEALVDSIVADALKAEPDVPVEGAEESVVAEPEPAPAPAPEEAVLAAIEPTPEPIAPAPEAALEALVDSIVADTFEAALPEPRAPLEVVEDSIAIEQQVPESAPEPALEEASPLPSLVAPPPVPAGEEEAEIYMIGELAPDEVLAMPQEAPVVTSAEEVEAVTPLAGQSEPEQTVAMVEEVEALTPLAGQSASEEAPAQAEEETVATVATVAPTVSLLPEPPAEPLIDLAKLPSSSPVLTTPELILANARPSDEKDDRPQVAVVVIGLGLGSAATTAAIQLPGAITLAFASHARDLQKWIDLARAAGHEVLLDLPMEPENYPTIDPGPQALLTSLSGAENAERLRWHLGRASGYVGVTHNMGSRFTASSDDMRPILSALKVRGLMFLDTRTSANSIAASLATTIGLPRAINNRSLDVQASRPAIDRRLDEIERIARRVGYSVAVGHAYPVTVERLTIWIKSLEEKQISLVPVSALANRQKIE